ncbi:TPA: hypothetical protein ACPXFP_002202, partial [Streptococcus pneumoniae]
NGDTDELFVGSLNLDAAANRGSVQVFDVTAPATFEAAKPLATILGEQTMFGSSGLLGGSVQAATHVDEAGRTHNRAAVSANGGVYIFEGVNAVTLTKTTSLAPGNASPSAIEGRNVADYTVHVENTTGGDLIDFVVTDDLSNVSDDADVSDVTASKGTAVLDGDALTWTGDLVAGDSLTITYTATVKSSVTADDENVQDYTEPVAALVNTVKTARIVEGATVAVPSVRDAADAADRTKWTDGVTVTTPIDGALKLSKSAIDADGNGRASAGETVVYTVTAKNVGGLPIIDADVLDDLTEVLKYASAPGSISVVLTDRDGTELTAPAAAFVAPMLSWTGDVPAGATLTLSYEVTVKDAAELYPLEGGEALLNRVESPNNVDPEGPTTTLPIEDELTLEKTASPDTGSTVVPGDEIVYTLTIKNKDQEVAKTGVTVTDNLAAVLPYASIVGDPSNGATISGNTLTWNGTVAAGGTQTITYTVRVLDTARDGQLIGNHVSSAQVRENPPGT